MSHQRERVVRDPLYGYVSIPKRLEPFVDHPQVQRLRYISQTSFASAVYPSMTGSRFEHSLGTMHLADAAWDCLARNSAESDFKALLSEIRSTDDLGIPDEYDDRQLSDLVRDALALVGLLHDVGHTAFSHALEPFYELYWNEIKSDDDQSLGDLKSKYGQQRKPHELFGCKLTEDILHDAYGGKSKNEEWRVFLTIAHHIYLPSSTELPWATALHEIIDGEIDVDRLDYIMRDSQRAGTEFGVIDFRRLIDSIEIHQNSEAAGWRVGYGLRAQSAIESLLVQRLQAYRWILFHPRVVACDLFVLRSVQMLMSLYQKAPTSLAPSFQQLKPHLNYVTSSGLPELAPEQFDNDLYDISDVNEAAIQIYRQQRQRPLADDASIMNWIQLGAVEAERHITTGRLPKDNEWAARRLITYYDTLVLRRKNIHVAWKRFDTYHDFAKSAYPTLFDAIFDIDEDNHSIFDELRTAYGDAAAAFIQNVQTEADIAKLDSYSNPNYVGLLHCVARRAVGADGLKISADLLRYCKDHLELPDSLPGKFFWELTFRGFKAIETGLNGTWVFEQDKSRLLTTMSELAASLQDAENYRIKLFAYLVFVTHTDISGKLKDREPELRRTVQTFLTTHLPALLVEHYKAALHAGAKRAQEEGNLP